MQMLYETEWRFSFYQILGVIEVYFEVAFCIEELRAEVKLLL